jgi:hypothetical protein
MVKVTLLLFSLVATSFSLQIQQQSEEKEYETSTSSNEPAKRAERLEHFLSAFPESKFRVQALETLLSLYYHAGNIEQLESAARRLLKMDSGSERAIRAIKYVGAHNYQQQFNPDDVRSSSDPMGGAEEGATLVKAMEITEDGPKAAALETFLTSFPTSRFAENALVVLVGTYQRLKNSDAVKLTSERLLKVSQDNVFGLAAMIGTYSDGNERGTAKDEYDSKLLDYGQRGQKAILALKKPSNVSQTDFDNAQRQLTNIFNSTVLTVLVRSKSWMATTIEVVSSGQGQTQASSFGHPPTVEVFLKTIFVGQHETLRCTELCSGFQPGIYNAETKKGEIKIHGNDLKNGKGKSAIFHISGTW